VTQLGIFEDSRSVMLRNDLAQAVLLVDAAGARAARERLALEFPDDGALADATTLIAALESRDGAALRHAGDVQRELQHLEHAVSAAARCLLGDRAAAPWLASRWRELARRAGGLPYRRESPDTHAAALWLRGHDWSAAADAVTHIESWRRIPPPLSWMVQARWHLSGMDAAWPLLAELAWLAPQRMHAIVRALPDPALHRLLRRFDAGFKSAGASDGAAWFPAWVLTDEPRLADALSTAETTHDSKAEQALSAMLALLRLERQGRRAEVIEHRRRLRALHAELFACYMRGR
jgi:hypothetical protein